MAPAVLHNCTPAGCTLVAVVVPSIWKPLKLLGGTAGKLLSCHHAPPTLPLP